MATPRPPARPNTPRVSATPTSWDKFRSTITSSPGLTKTPPWVRHWDRQMNEQTALRSTMPHYSTGALNPQIGDVCVVAAVAPEAQVDAREFDATCRAAEPTITDRGGMTMTKLSDLTSSAQLAADELRDPEVVVEVERTSGAEQVALLLTSFRVEHGLTQTGLAELLGMQQPAIARLEAGSHEPSLATLARLSTALGVSLDVHIAPDSVVLQSA